MIAEHLTNLQYITNTVAYTRQCVEKGLASTTNLIFDSDLGLGQLSGLLLTKKNLKIYFTN